MSNHHLNIEIKAYLRDIATIRQVLTNHKATFKGIDHQIDTYFECHSGRLKLRKGNIENNLIHYERENSKEPKASIVSLYAIGSDTEKLKNVLSNALQVKVVVDKKREIYFVKNVKFHIDEVLHLGSFVEIEAIDIDGTLGQKRLEEQCRYFMQAFNIQEKDLIHQSYSDLLLEKLST
ncbi:MAG: class IV adenylate cyclase [Chitinophagales bacterium]